MDSTASQLLLQNHRTVLVYNALLEQACGRSDSGYYSGSGSLSPASSIDSCCLSPPSLQCGCGARQEAYDCDTHFGSQVYPQQSLLLPVQTKRRSRSKYPGKKRQSASDREKLRMRDLTKALHHLRTYLPPSVAPAGQTLTKIETLRLTIRYISHLSEQLGLSEEAPSQRRGADRSEGPQDDIQLQDCWHSNQPQQPDGNVSMEPAMPYPLPTLTMQSWEVCQY
ncbi:mesoderm posterior protein 2-like [Huso huso]|uniref:Mesoderm posterior protein 2-like n=1 Tax=Huso huso TaxID=61971 RepID=A0ABR0YQU2_HUSHU